MTASRGRSWGRRTLFAAIACLLVSAAFVGTESLPSEAHLGGAHAGRAWYQSANGFLGELCGHKGDLNINDAINAQWWGEAYTHLSYGSPCLGTPGGGCCTAGDIEVWMNMQRQSNLTYCLTNSTYAPNWGGYTYAYVTIDACGGNPPEGTKRGVTAHMVNLYGTDFGNYFETGWHTAYIP